MKNRYRIIIPYIISLILIMFCIFLSITTNNNSDDLGLSDDSYVALDDTTVDLNSDEFDLNVQEEDESNENENDSSNSEKPEYDVFLPMPENNSPNLDTKPDVNEDPSLDEEQDLDELPNVEPDELPKPPSNDSEDLDDVISEIHLTDIQSQIKNVQDNNKVVTYDVDHQGDKISLYDGNDEIEFEKGIVATGGDVCITFTDLKMYGYETFNASLGAHSIARILNSNDTSFSIKIVLDNDIVYESVLFDAYTELDYVEIDLTGYEVLQIFIDTKGSGLGDYVAIANPIFTKEGLSPYIDVFDLEFNSPHQVTKSNILQYADAWDVDLTNLSNNIYYETDYKSGEIGEFSLTYYVEGSTGILASRTVKLTVTGQDYTDPWTLSDYKTPYVNYLYHTRNTLTPQNRKLFDIVLPSILDFNPEGGEFYTVSNYTKWEETVYEIKFDLQKADIFLKINEFNAFFHNTILDTDPRAYIFKQWDCSGRYTSDSSTGLLKTYHMFISIPWYSAYDTQIEKIIANSEVFLDYAKDDMTDEQKLYYVTTPYKNWIQYNDGATISTALGNGYGKCGGNAMGVSHLAQRLGIASLYGQVYTSWGELHAASYQKLVDVDGWYMCDKLFAYQWSAPQQTSFSLSKRSGYGWIEYADTSVSSYKYATYPSVWLDFEVDMLIIPENESVNLYDNIKSIGTIFDDDLNNDIISIYVKDKDDKLITEDISNLPLGLYTVYYDIAYKNSNVTINRTQKVNLAIFDQKRDFSNDQVISSSNVHSYGNKGLYNSTDKIEEYYYGVDINNGGYITIDNSLGYEAISLKFGPKTYCRTDSWASSFCKVRLHVYFDGVLQTSTATLTAFSNYATVGLAIPEGVTEIKLYAQDVGGSAGHSTIGDIKLYTLSSEL